MAQHSLHPTHPPHQPATAQRTIARGTTRIVVVGWALLIPAFLFGAGLGRNVGTGSAEPTGQTARSAPPPPAEIGREAGVEHAAEQPVLIELFTSQGCSSCPPADRLLGELGKRPHVIPLAFHVDYWNHLGWKDPFSSARWSDRQRRYANWLDEDTIYTPQLIVAGTQHFVGSDGRAIDRALDRVLNHAQASAERKSHTLDLRVHQGRGQIQARLRLHGPRPNDDVERWVALYERHLAIDIGRGENSGRTLEYDYVVRDLRSAQDSQLVTFDLEPEWRAENLGVVAFAQRSTDGKVVGVVRASTRELVD